MKELLDDMERTLADLMLSGYGTGAELAGRFRRLGDECRRIGLQNGGLWMEEIAAALEQRTHSIQKEDLALTELLCRAAGYVRLCREKIQETQIIARWDAITGGNP